MSTTIADVPAAEGEGFEAITTTGFLSDVGLLTEKQCQEMADGLEFNENISLSDAAALLATIRDLRQQVADLTSQETKFTLEDVAEATGKDKRTVQHHIRQLQSKGQVSPRKGAHGRFYLTDAEYRAVMRYIQERKRSRPGA